MLKNFLKWWRDTWLEAVSMQHSLKIIEEKDDCQMTNHQALEKMEKLMAEGLGRHEAALRLSKETGLDRLYLYWLPYNEVAKSRPEAPALKKNPWSEERAR